MKIRPLHDKILATRNTESEKSEGGLFIPEQAREKSQQMTVIAVGNGRILEDGTVRPLDVKPGDRILVGKYLSNELEINGEKFVMLTENEVLAVVERKK